MRMAMLLYAPYIALAAVYCADAWGKGRLSRYLKPLLMPALLLAYALSAARMDALIVLGLMLGFVGDCALMLPNERYGGKPLLIGLGAFMLGHLMYIAHFALRVGGALLELSQIGKVCHTKCAIYHLAGDCIFPREGVFFVALEDGEVKPGDSVQVVALGDGTCAHTPPEALEELRAAREG